MGAHSTAPASGSSAASSGCHTVSSPLGSSIDWLTSAPNTEATVRLALRPPRDYP